MAGNARTAACPTLQETLRSLTLFWLVGSRHRDPGDWAGLPQGLSASLSSSQQDLLCLAPIQPVPGMALLLLRLSRSNGPYLLEPVSLLSGAVHLQIPF